MKTTVTVTDIMYAKPCETYSQEDVKALWKGKEILTPREISSLDIPIEDRLWALINAVLDSKNQRLFACDCAERALTREVEKGSKIDSRSLKAIEVSRKYAEGLATASELAAAYSAARAAAWDAASYAASSVARSAASDAAWAAVRAAAYDAAWAATSKDARYAARSFASVAAYDVAYDAEVSWQIEHILEMVELGCKS